MYYTDTYCCSFYKETPTRFMCFVSELVAPLHNMYNFTAAFATQPLTSPKLKTTH